MTTTNLIGRHQVLEKYDEVLLWITIALLVFGLVMVYFKISIEYIKRYLI